MYIEEESYKNQRRNAETNIDIKKNIHTLGQKVPPPAHFPL